MRELRKSKTLAAFLCGASVFTLMSGGVVAQDAPEPLPFVAPEVAPDAADGAADGAASPADAQAGGLHQFDGSADAPPSQPLAEEGGARALPEDMDPMSKPVVRQLDGDNVVQRKIGLGLELKLLQDEIQRMDSIGKLIEALGVDGFKASFPDLYEQLKSSPAILEAEIKYHELQHQLEAAKEGPKPEEETLDAAQLLTPRDDGSAFFMMPEPDVQPIPDIPEPIDPAAELLEEPLPEAPPEPVDVSISLREVYGIAGSYYAIIMHGEERVRVSKGDQLPGETEIRDIGDGYIDIIRRGEEIRIRIQG